MTSMPRRIRTRLRFATTPARPRANRPSAKPRFRARNPSAMGCTSRLVAQEEDDREDPGEDDERLNEEVERASGPQGLADPGRAPWRGHGRRGGREQRTREDREQRG